MINDTISDMLTRIRNGGLVKSQTVTIPFTKISQQIAYILEREGFIDSFLLSSSEDIIIRLKYTGQQKRPCITNLRRISKPGLRVYVNHKEIPRLLGGIGVVILSTSKGIMTDNEARLQGIGGEILCSIW